MTVKYGKFEMPEKIKLDEASQTANFGRFIVEPFERGFGHTVGSALRRIMLGSLEAPSIISVRIEGVPHEYMAIDGVIQDMTHIVLNLKGALLRRLPLSDEGHPRDIRVVTEMLDVTDEMLEKGGGEYKVTLKFDIAKVYIDNKGNDVPAKQMDDYIDIGIFGADIKNKEGRSGVNPLYLKKYKLKYGMHEITVVVKGKPVRAGIDPYAKLSDRNVDDNMKEF